MKNDTKHMTLASRRNSFIYAFNGLKLLPKEPNIILHSIATVGVLVAGFVRHLESQKWIALIVAIALVWITETLNTCIERLCDFACDHQQHPAIKSIKDMAAGAVLIASAASIIIGIIVFFL